MRTILHMVHAGIGVSVMPALAQSMLPPECVLVPIHPPTQRRLHLTGPAGRHWHPAVSALIAATPPLPART